MSYFNRALKTDKNGVPVPQIFNPAVNDFQVLEGSGNQMPMFDAGAHARLDAIEQKIDGIIDGTTPASVQLTGSKTQLDTVLNAVSIAPGSYQQFNFNPTTEDEIWVHVSVDKQPWSIHTSTEVYGGSDASVNTIFPRRHNQNTTHGVLLPCVSLFLGGISVGAVEGLTAPTTLLEAKQLMIPYKSNAVGRIQIESSADGTATVTVKLLRVWKKG